MDTSIEQNVVLHLKHNTAHMKHNTTVCKLAWVPWHAYGKSISLESHFAKCGLTKVLFHPHKWVLDRTHQTCRAMLLKIAWRSERWLSLSGWRRSSAWEWKSTVRQQEAPSFKLGVTLTLGKRTIAISEISQTYLAVLTGMFETGYILECWNLFFA